MNKTTHTISLISLLVMILLPSSVVAEQSLNEQQINDLEISGKYRELLLGGDVKATWEKSCLVSGCGGRGCKLTIKTAVIEDRIYVDGDIGSCDSYGYCSMCIKSSTSTTLKDLPRKKYKIYTSQFSDRVLFTIVPTEPKTQ
ncbi:MAG: hypothetical protein AB2606_19225 [Candidatus Thiodiazotropha taylori]